MSDKYTAEQMEETARVIKRNPDKLDGGEYYDEVDKASDMLRQAAQMMREREVGVHHPDDAAVDAFAAAMKAKLAEARAKGRSGWQDKQDCPQQRLSNMLRDHVEKGDPLDVGNFCMFLHQRGESILPKGGRTMRQLAADFLGHEREADVAAGFDPAKAAREIRGSIIRRLDQFNEKWPQHWCGSLDDALGAAEVIAERLESFAARRAAVPDGWNPTDAEVREWLARSDLDDDGRLDHWRTVIDDARSMHMLAAHAQMVEKVRKVIGSIDLRAETYLDPQCKIWANKLAAAIGDAK